MVKPATSNSWTDYIPHKNNFHIDWKPNTALNYFKLFRAKGSAAVSIADLGGIIIYLFIAL